MTAVAIAAAWESAHSPTLGGSVGDLHAEAATRAAGSVGLRPADIHGVACAPHSPIDLAASLGVDARWVESTYIGNCSALIAIIRAAAAIAVGDVELVVITHAESLRSMTGVVWLEPPVAASSAVGQFEAPHGAGNQGRFALHLARYMAESGIGESDLAAVAVVAREWARRHPGAKRREPLTIDDVLASPFVVEPLRRLMFGVTTDYAGAIVVTTLDRARRLTANPVVVLGGGEAYETELASQLDDPCAPRSLGLAATRALQRAGIGVADIDHAMVFDGFAHAALMCLEALGVCERGRGAEFVSAGHTAPGGRLPTNTNGGFLSYRHGEMAQIIECFHQLRGDAHAQVDGASISFVHGVGPTFSSSVALALGRDRP